MVHIGDAPVPLKEILSELAPGDIVTHCYTGSPHGMASDGRLVPDVHSARRRGVRFDVGHGFGSFDYEVAERAVGEGLWPDTISTDLHSLSAQGPAIDLPTTMSKFLSMGMPLNDVIEATTTRPAEILGRSGTIGSLEIGRVADVAVLRLESGEFGFRDAFGHERTGGKRLAAVATIRAGIPWAGPWPHPGRSIGALPN
jgi:dihydroorotase